MNLEHVLPNKFFEFIQARLAVLIGPSVEMVPFVERYGLGFVASDFSAASLAKRLAEVSVEEIDKCKRNADASAWEISAATEMEKLVRFVNSVMNQRVDKGYLAN